MAPGLNIGPASIQEDRKIMVIFSFLQWYNGNV